MREIEPWTALLDDARGPPGGSSARRSSSRARPQHGRAARRRSHPRAAARRCAAPASSALHATRPRRSRPPGPARRSSRPAPPRASRCASTCRCSTRSLRDAQGPRALPLPDQGARPGPGARDRALGLPQRSARRSTTATRRARRAARSAAARTSSSPTPTCSTSAILPHHERVGRPVRQPRGRRRRRGAHLPRRLRLARRQRPAAAAADRRRLRRRAALPARLGDDRQPGRAGRAADRARGRRADRARRRAVGRPARSRSGTRRSIDEALGIAPLGARRGRRAAGRARRARARARSASRARARRVELIDADRARRARARSAPASCGELVMPYRAGYTPRSGARSRRGWSPASCSAVVTTDALELGIDVGALDAAIVVTFPGTIASLRQMWGRAGRRRRGLALYVAGEDALDQFFARHTDDFLDRPVESAILDHESEEIHLAHLLCAAHEGPLSEADAEFFGPRTLGYLERLEGLGELRARDGRCVLRRARALPRRRGLAALGLARLVRDRRARDRRGARLGRGARAPSRRSTRAPSTCTSGAATSSASSTSTRAARSSSRSTATGTRSRKRETDTLIERLLDRREALGVTLSFGRVAVTEQVLAYQRRGLADHREIDIDRARAAADALRDPGDLVRARRRRARRASRRRCCSARCTPPSTPRSRCCRCWRCATAGTSAASRPTSTPRPARRRSSSTTATPAASASRASRFAYFEGWSPTPTA